jgi:hypothetical protein
MRRNRLISGAGDVDSIDGHCSYVSPKTVLMRDYGQQQMRGPLRVVVNLVQRRAAAADMIRPRIRADARVSTASTGEDRMRDAKP